MSDAPGSLRAPEPISAGLDTSSRNDEKAQVDDLGPTDSHVLSQVKPEEEDRGLAQKAGVTNDVSDIGWGESDKIEERIVTGLSNEDLWMLIRRFNKQIYCVKAVPNPPLQRLDLNRAEDENFSPDKLRATLERFYTTVVIGLTSLVKHIARLRSWREPRRTAAFCAVYSVAWLLDFLVPTLFGTMLVLVVWPQSRKVLFPPAPLALVDKSTGGVQKPKAGVLGSHDSVTGAPEKYKGEAAEQEASNLIASVATVAVGSAAGKHDQGTPEDAPMESSVPDAMDIVSKTADAQAAAGGEVPADTHDKTRQPMKETVLNGANLAMRVLSDIIDTYERFGNALSPTPPFPASTPCLRLSSVLVAGFLGSLPTSSYVFVKLGTFLFGFVFFGDPVLQRFINYLNHAFPHWQKLLNLQNSLLKRVPTNAQLTLTLLRIGESNAAPLPPPPSSSLHKAPSRPAPIHHDQLALGASTEEISRAAAPEPKQDAAQEPHKDEEPKKKSLGARIVGFFKGTTATGIEAKLAVDRVRAQAGSTHAKNHVGILRKKGEETLPYGPVEFDARYKGKRGNVVIDSSKQPPLLYFTTDPTVIQGDYRLDSRKKGTVLFTIPVTEIQEMRKIGGMGWKGKLAAGWAVGCKEVVDGLVIIGEHPHDSYQLTAMSTRNELFNRLVAIDGQVWESF
ncbi:hypothetical protein KXW29_007758 [Aspergillus fumigatus]|uniref:Uncharacterized protein n=1 Tax=Aspergillus fumigatus TaxID=746128 RepID=A0A9P8ST22_ASPFM|nr:hypothetical protein KXX32_004110 [Aspergillus fumigatus]KAH1906563.1 hypothetical protein KXV57_005398 [Aspergillus fumigatus]KAH2291040.1 hypothetical protein KXW02_003275 [Aspergillus fumigatus]KAH2728924.1 hypothetical protein KXW29_007758 [Aspergillus fumigatus]